MQKNLNIGFIICMVFFFKNTFAQKTYLDLVLNQVSTNLNYGDKQSSLKEYTQSAKGFQGGLSFQVGITPSFSLVPGLFYRNKGGKLKVNNPETKKETTLHFKAIEMPLLARFHIGKMYLNAGPSVAYNLSGTNKIENDKIDLIFKDKIGGYRRWEAGLQIGGGYEFPIKNKRISVDLRYNYGLTNISFDKEVYNRSFIVSVHYSKAWKKNLFEK